MGVALVPGVANQVAGGDQPRDIRSHQSAGRRWAVRRRGGQGCRVYSAAAGGSRRPRSRGSRGRGFPAYPGAVRAEPKQHLSCRAGF